MDNVITLLSFLPSLTPEDTLQMLYYAGAIALTASVIGFIRTVWL